ncbi:MAG: hypothetical protein ACXABY_15235, partial [Candidatus Thorarchaeota archaeon]
DHKSIPEWLKVVVAAFIPLIAAAVAFGIVQTNVANNQAQLERVIESKADKVVAEMQQNQLDRIENKLDRLLIEMRTP